MLNDDTPIGDALAHHYAAHGLPPDGGAGRRLFFIRVGPLSIPAPNPASRRRAVLPHDIHHLLTGYDTVFSRGEMIIAGYEIGTGCGPFVFAWLVNLWMLALGALITPRAVFTAFVRGRRCKSVYRLTEDRAALLRLTIGELKARLGLDRPPTAPTRRDRATFAMWCAAAWLVTLACAAIAAGTIFGVAAALRWLVSHA